MIAAGKQDLLELGNLDAGRDWGFAGDYVEGMWRMLQAEAPADYVLATGKTVSVRAFVEHAGEALGLKIAWTGKGVDEKGVDEKTGKTVVAVSKKFFRPAEVEVLTGNPAKAESELGWRRKVDFPGLVAMMAEADARRVRDDDLQF
jgi:GDPmannose 4,6-dehydratase